MNRPRIALLMLMVIYTTLLLAVGYAADETETTGQEFRGTTAAYDPEQALLYYGPLDTPSLPVDAYEDPYLNEAYGLPSRNDLWVGAQVEEADYSGESTLLDAALSPPISNPTLDDVATEDLVSAPMPIVDRQEVLAPVVNTEPYDLDDLFYAEQQPTLAPPKPKHDSVVSTPVYTEDDYFVEFGVSDGQDNGCPLVNESVNSFVQDTKRCLRSYLEQAEQRYTELQRQDATTSDDETPSLSRKGKYRDVAAAETQVPAIDELDCDQYLLYIHDEFGWYDVPRSPSMTPMMTATVIMPAAPLVAVKENEWFDDEFQWDCHAPTHLVKNSQSYDPRLPSVLDPEVNWSRLWWPEVPTTPLADASREGIDLADWMNIQNDGLLRIQRSETAKLFAAKLTEWFASAQQQVGDWMAEHAYRTPTTGVADATFDELLDFSIRNRGDVNFEWDEF